MVYGGGGVEAVDTADHLVDGAEAHVGHDFAELLGDEEEVVDDVFGLSGEHFPEDRILGGDADGAGVEVAFAEHDAAHDDERGGGEAELLGAEEAGDGNVAPGLELAVSLDDDAAAEVVHDEDLLGLGDA